MNENEQQLLNRWLHGGQQRKAAHADRMALCCKVGRTGG